MVRKPRQGDILLLNTAPRSGHEQTGKRPYIVLTELGRSRPSSIGG